MIMITCESCNRETDGYPCCQCKYDPTDINDDPEFSFEEVMDGRPVQLEIPHGT